MSQHIIQDEVFGTVRCDEKTRIYEATIQLAPERSILVTIDSMGISPADALKRAREIYNVVSRREREYRRAAASELLNLYNESWSETHRLDNDELMRRLSLSSITIAPGESDATVYYADGGLFGGHCIEVFLNEDFSFAKAQLAG